MGRPKKSKRPRFQAPVGMHDILPERQEYFQKIYEVAENIAKFCGFQKLDTPILEQAELFSKGVGLFTDIVEKEMYTFRTKGGDFLTLRPEGTAGIARAYIEHGMFNLPSPVKLWYFGPYFRYEHPQAGRFRQFHHLGFEVFKEASPVIDVQVIEIFYNILRELKFKDLIIELNSIGDSHCRSYYKKLLVSYLKNRETLLCPNCRKRIKKNPLRVLDCKEEKCQKIVTRAPQMIDHLCEECHTHFKGVLEFLDEIGLPYRLNPYLVRGLDYYTKTVFELIAGGKSLFGEGASISRGLPEESEPEESKPEEGKEVCSPDANERPKEDDAARDGFGNLSLVGGGRYDALLKLLGGRDAPACGAALGVERVVSIMEAKQMLGPFRFPGPQIFLAQLGNLAKRRCLKIFEDFRKARIPAVELFSKDSLNIQLKVADKLKVNYTLILGQKEVLDDTIIVREMRTGKQEVVRLDEIINEMKRRLRR